MKNLLRSFIIFVLIFFNSLSTLDAQSVNPKSQLTREQKENLKRTEWFYKAKYGIMFHFVPSMARFKQIPWTTEEWNACVNAADVEKVAQQAEEIGAGYVIISIGQKGDYYCAPNPVYQKYWGFTDGQYNSKRDLPMDLFQALKKRGIKMMFYVTSIPFASPSEAGEKNGWFGERRNYEKGKTSMKGERIWLECLQWYSDHYGKAASGWWVDGLNGYSENYNKELREALLHGNKKAIITSGDYEESDFIHGHCTGKWEEQQKRLPTQGRLDEKYGIQWHAFQYLGHSWAAKGVDHTTESIVNYATEVIKLGGVITFDIGTFQETCNTCPVRRNNRGIIIFDIGTFQERPKIEGPTLFIPDDQFEQLKAVKNAVANIKNRK